MFLNENASNLCGLCFFKKEKRNEFQLELNIFNGKGNNFK